jgi:hypothetical protein
LLPSVTSIGSFCFIDTGTMPLKVTLGATPPTLGENIFYMNGGPVSKTVTVEVPSGATGYGTLPLTVSDTDESWANGFRGGGWDGNNFTTTSDRIKTSVNLTIKTL